jgi:hypothetical protein
MISWAQTMNKHALIVIRFISLYDRRPKKANVDSVTPQQSDTNIYLNVQASQSH